MNIPVASAKIIGSRIRMTDPDRKTVQTMGQARRELTATQARTLMNAVQTIKDSTVAGLFLINTDELATM